MQIKNMLKFLSDPVARFQILNSRGFYKNMPDEKFLKKAFKIRMGYELNLDNPQTFNEKLQWLKLYDRKPQYSKLVDKYEVREHVKKMIGEEYLIPLVGGPWNDFDEIDFQALPKQFVLKCTHDSGGLIICRDKDILDLDKARKKINRSMKRNYYLHMREWPYKDVKPRIIAEQYMQDNGREILPVYKIFCFNGIPKLIQTIQNDKQASETIDYFNTDWELLKLKQNFPNSKIPYNRPEQLELMLEIAQTLSKDKAFLRVDLYTVGQEIKFSEHTFFSDSGLEKYHPELWDETMGQWLKLPEGGYWIVNNQKVLAAYEDETNTLKITKDADGHITEVYENRIGELTDYKFFAFDGQVRAMFVATDRASTTEETKFDFFDMEYNHLPFTNGHPNAVKLPKKPEQFELMAELAGKLSQGIPNTRIDFYEVNGRIYFGEITLFHWSGLTRFEPKEWDEVFGNWIKLPKERKC